MGSSRILVSGATNKKLPTICSFGSRTGTTKMIWCTTMHYLVGGYDWDVVLGLSSILTVLFGRKRFGSVAMSVYQEGFCKMGSCLSGHWEKTHGLNLVVQLSWRTWVLWALLSQCCWLRSLFLWLLLWWKCRVWASGRQALALVVLPSLVDSLSHDKKTPWRFIETQVVGRNW